MKAIQCEMCGSNDVVKQGDYFVCQNCGIKYEPEAARKLMVEVDNSKALENLYTLARRARDTNDAENALGYYSKILQSNPNDWEAYFFGAYFKALQTKQAYIADAADTLRKAVAATFDLLNSGGNDIETIELAAHSMLSKIPDIAESFAANAKDIYESYKRISESAALEHLAEYIARRAASLHLFDAFVGSMFDLADQHGQSDMLKSLAASAGRRRLDAPQDLFNLDDEEKIALYKRIQEYDPSYQDGWYDHLVRMKEDPGYRADIEKEAEEVRKSVEEAYEEQQRKGCLVGIIGLAIGTALAFLLAFALGWL